MNNKVKKIAKQVTKEFKGHINIIKLKECLKRQGYSTVFYNTPEGDAIINAYNLPDTTKIKKAFTYCGATKIVFVNYNDHMTDKIYSLLHELGHIVLGHLKDHSIALSDKELLELEAEVFAYEILKRNKVLNVPI